MNGIFKGYLEKGYIVKKRDTKESFGRSDHGDIWKEKMIQTRWKVVLSLVCSKVLPFLIGCGFMVIIQDKCPRKIYLNDFISFYAPNMNNGPHKKHSSRRFENLQLGLQFRWDPEAANKSVHVESQLRRNSSPADDTVPSTAAAAAANPSSSRGPEELYLVPLSLADARFELTFVPAAHYVGPHVLGNQP